MLTFIGENIIAILMWGLIASVAMSSILMASNGLGLSRLSLTFLVGTFFTSNRNLATVLGFILYFIGGWIFSFVYIFIFLSLKMGSWWLGLLFGLLHGIFLLVTLPVLSYIHPRMATEYDGPTDEWRLEPPGFMGLNYGYRTPFTTLIAQGIYGLIIGVCFQLLNLG